MEQNNKIPAVFRHTEVHIGQRFPIYISPFMKDLGNLGHHFAMAMGFRCLLLLGSFQKEREFVKDSWNWSPMSDLYLETEVPQKRILYVYLTRT